MNTNNALVRVVVIATIALLLTAATNVILGTSAKDTLVGTPGDDWINGLARADSMTGLAGNDTYVVDNQYDHVYEEPDEGRDTVRTSVDGYLPRNVENLVLTGSANLIGSGNALNNRITGNSGSNGLAGNGGTDTLLGRGGPDSFHFSWGFLPSLYPTPVTRMPDFNEEDSIVLYEPWEGLEFPYTWESSVPLASSQFRVGAVATTGSQRILYDRTTGYLRADPDGTGPRPAVVYAKLPAGLALTAGHIYLAPSSI